MQRLLCGTFSNPCRLYDIHGIVRAWALGRDVEYPWCAEAISEVHVSGEHAKVGRIRHVSGPHAHGFLWHRRESSVSLLVMHEGAPRCQNATPSPPLRARATHRVEASV